MEDKRVTHTARAILRIWNTGLFAFIWFYYYNKYMFDTYKIPGGLFSVLTFFIVYTALCSVYKAFRIASTNIGEIVFSQTISFAAGDLFLYVESILVYNQYVSFIPGLIILILQLLGTVVIVTAAKRYFMVHVEPQSTMLIYGKMHTLKETLDFEQRLLLKYGHLFRTEFVAVESIDRQTFLDRAKDCSTVILYDATAENRLRFMKTCIDLGKNFYYTPQLADVLALGCEPKHLLDTPLMKYEYVYHSKRKQSVKRLMDVIFSLLFIVLLSPVMLVTAICILIEDGRPVLFRQKRYTKDKEVFTILKFRSMIKDAEKNGTTPSTANDPRVTKVGRVIRKYRIDEVPQFFNVLLGDMSFVGPRPESVDMVEHYMQRLPEWRFRMVVKAGLTGYAQVFGKYNTSAEDKLLLDLMYIENQSTLQDFKIALLTIRTMFQPERTEAFSDARSQEINQSIRETRKRMEALGFTEQRELEEEKDAQKAAQSGIADKEEGLA